MLRTFNKDPLPLKSVVFELCVYKVTEVASKCHLYALLISAIIGVMFEMYMKLIQRDKKLFRMIYQWIYIVIYILKGCLL